MPDFNFTIHHSLSKAEVKRRIQAYYAELRVKYRGVLTDLRELWQRDRLITEATAAGLHVSGTVKIKADAILIEGYLPFLATLWVKPKIRSEAKKVLK